MQDGKADMWGARKRKDEIIEMGIEMVKNGYGSLDYVMNNLTHLDWVNLKIFLARENKRQGGFKDDKL